MRKRGGMDFEVTYRHTEVQKEREKHDGLDFEVVDRHKEVQKERESVEEWISK